MAGDQARAGDHAEPMSDRPLGIAANVFRSFGGAFGGRHLAIVGGAVPGLLVASPPAGLDPHVGTADLDLHLSLHPSTARPPTTTRPSSAGSDR